MRKCEFRRISIFTLCIMVWERWRCNVSIKKKNSLRYKNKIKIMYKLEWVETSTIVNSCKVSCIRSSSRRRERTMHYSTNNSIYQRDSCLPPYFSYFFLNHLHYLLLFIQVYFIFFTFFLSFHRHACSTRRKKYFEK